MHITLHKHLLDWKDKHVHFFVCWSALPRSLRTRNFSLFLFDYHNDLYNAVLFSLNLREKNLDFNFNFADVMLEKILCMEFVAV